MGQEGRSRWRRLAIKVLAGFGGFTTGFLAGMGSGAQVTGEVGAAFPEWGGAFIVGCGIAGGIAGAVLAVLATNIILPDEAQIYIDCYLTKMRAAAARTKDGVVSDAVAEAIYAECRDFAKKMAR
jgi:hypothetical protein